MFSNRPSCNADANDDLYAFAPHIHRWEDGRPRRVHGSIVLQGIYLVVEQRETEQPPALCVQRGDPDILMTSGTANDQITGKIIVLRIAQIINQLVIAQSRVTHIE